MDRAEALIPILSLAEGPGRTAAVAEWIQDLYEGEPPVLVGGAAVELYSGGSYTSGDLDFVGVVPSSVETLLRQAGFERRGRHWIHGKGVFVEFPGVRLEPHQRVTRLLSEGHEVVALSVEDLLVDRLAHWQFWGSTIDALNALTLWRFWSESLDRDRLEAAATAREVAPALRSLQRFVARHSGSDPDEEEVGRWASRPPT